MPLKYFKLTDDAYKICEYAVQSFSRRSYRMMHSCLPLNQNDPDLLSSIKSAATKARNVASQIFLKGKINIVVEHLPGCELPVGWLKEFSSSDPSSNDLKIFYTDLDAENLQTTIRCEDIKAKSETESVGVIVNLYDLVGKGFALNLFQNLASYSRPVLSSGSISKCWIDTSKDGTSYSISPLFACIKSLVILSVIEQHLKPFQDPLKPLRVAPENLEDQLIGMFIKNALESKKS